MSDETYFVTGPTANLTAELKFELHSFRCLSPRTAPDLPVRSLQSRSLGFATLSTRTLDVRDTVRTLGVKMCWRDENTGHIKCWADRILNDRCYNLDSMPFLRNVVTLSLDKQNTCIFSDNDECGTKDGHSSFTTASSPDLGRNGMIISPKSVICSSPKSIPSSFPATEP